MHILSRLTLIYASRDVKLENFDIFLLLFYTKIDKKLILNTLFIF